MSGIPADIMRTARTLADDATCLGYTHAALDIARAILAERERCAQISELRLTEALTKRHMVDLPPFLAKYDGDLIRAIAAAIRSAEREGE
jgi:hypothetical protein